MHKELIPSKASVQVRALFVGRRLELRGLESSRLLPVLPLIISAGDQGYAVLFRYGAVVLFNLEPAEQLSFLNHIKHLIRDPFDAPDTGDLLAVARRHAGS